MDFVTVKDGSIESVTRDCDLDPGFRKMMENDGYEFVEIPPQWVDRLNAAFRIVDGRLQLDASAEAAAVKKENESNRRKLMPDGKDYALALYLAGQGDASIKTRLDAQIQGAISQYPIDS